MGTITDFYDSTGNVVARYAYDAWGRLLTVKDGSGNILNPTANPGEPGIVNPFRYRGYMYDDESGLYYLNSRYYDPETGRFVNADSLIIGDQYVLGANVYAYCANNPIFYSDPSGCSFTATATALYGLYLLGTVIITALAIPVTQKLGDMLVDAVSSINITSVPLPSESSAVTIDPPAVNEKEETVAVPVPDEATKADTKTNKRPHLGYYYEAILLGPGNGIYVRTTTGMTYEEAFNQVVNGQDIWVFNKELAENLAFFAAGGHAFIKPKKPQKCTPVPGWNDAGCISGTAAFHYHVAGKKYGGVHVFFGEQAVIFGP